MEKTLGYTERQWAVICKKILLFFHSGTDLEFSAIKQKATIEDTTIEIYIYTKIKRYKNMTIKGTKI